MIHNIQRLGPPWPQRGHRGGQHHRGPTRVRTPKRQQLGRMSGKQLGKSEKMLDKWGKSEVNMIQHGIHQWSRNVEAKTVENVELGIQRRQTTTEAHDPVGATRRDAIHVEVSILRRYFDGFHGKSSSKNDENCGFHHGLEATHVTM